MGKMTNILKSKQIKYITITGDVLYNDDVYFLNGYFFSYKDHTLVKRVEVEFLNNSYIVKSD